MGLECIILSKSARGRKILYDSTDMWNLKNKTKLVDTESKLILQEAGMRVGKMDEEGEI